MATYTLAGRYGSLLFIPIETSVVVCTVGTTTPITLYTDKTMGTTAANPLATGVSANTPGIDVNGNILFYAYPGEYDVIVAGQPYTQNVMPNVAEWGVPGLVPIFYNGSSWPSRASVIPNTIQSAIWIGPDAQKAGSIAAGATATDIDGGY